MAETLLVLLLIAPVAAGSGCLSAPGARASERVNVAGAGLTLGLAGWLTALIARDGAFEAVRGVFYVDELSALMLAAIAIVTFAAALSSVGYLRTELGHGAVPQGERGVRLYYAGLHALTATMFVTVTVDSLGLLWVGIEATTVASALLVGFYRGRAALEAAWKYVVLCTVGITCALFGVMLTYFAARIGSGPGSLDWSMLAAERGALDPDLMRLAFAFILVGFGTKAGLAPLHTWLADAHSQAPSPISGLLSGVLLACAMYGILRFQPLTASATGSRFSNHLLLGFGLLSVAVAAPFILVARDLKRMLAYSSLEHMGLMAVAFGIGGPAAIAAGLLHLAGHAAVKTLLFILAGPLKHRFGSYRIRACSGLVSLDPARGALLAAGLLAIGGMPPFSIFVSEVGILAAGFGAGGWSSAVTAATLALLAVIFAGLMRHAIAMCGGRPRGDAPAHHRSPGETSGLGIAAVVPLLAVMLLFGVYVPGPARELFRDIAAIIEPGMGGVVAQR